MVGSRDYRSQTSSWSSYAIANSRVNNSFPNSDILGESVPEGLGLDELQLSLNQILEELFVCHLHLRENLGGGLRSNTIDALRNYSPLPIGEYDIS
jgi:hypothetical protein